MYHGAAVRNSKRIQRRRIAREISDFGRRREERARDYLCQLALAVDERRGKTWRSSLYVACELSSTPDNFCVSLTFFFFFYRHLASFLTNTTDFHKLSGSQYFRKRVNSFLSYPLQMIHAGDPLWLRIIYSFDDST
ncbi:hypothetical protein PUN28_000130 [Cardiocondyla obscurior]|uniref:Uncharacterized protein n=1 Tax=Cardiocondyla obscurior TaxID=286306 RepID=A0AAW2GXX3_9HYME